MAKYLANVPYIPFFVYCTVFFWVSASARTNTSGDFPNIVMTLMGDIHYDGLFGGPGGYAWCSQTQKYAVVSGCDSPQELVFSLVADVRSQKKSYSLITGNLIRHGTAKLLPAAVERMISEVLEHLTLARERNDENKTNDVSLQEMIPTQVAIGLSDLVPDGSFYISTPHVFLNRFTSMMVEHRLLTKTEKVSMDSCGFYYRDLDRSKLRVISLNTPLWSNDLRPQLTVGDVDPCGQFPFLKNAIREAEQLDRKVIVLGSVPPILNVDETLRRGEVKEEDSYWRSDFREAYFRIIAMYRFTVQAQFFGHAQHFGFVTLAKVGSPIYIVPSISPIRGNNPSYLRVSLEHKTGRVVELRQRYLKGENVWVDGESLEDIFPTAFKNQGDHMQKAYFAITENDALWDRFLKMRHGGQYLQNRSACRSWCRRVIVCSALYHNPEEISSCAAVELPSQSTGTILAAVFTVFGVGSIFVSLTYVLLRWESIFGSPKLNYLEEDAQRPFSKNRKSIYSPS